MTKKQALLSSIGIFVAMGVFGLSAAEAQENQAGLVISPPKTEKTITEGESFSDVIKVTNSTSSDLVLNVSIADFGPKDETGEPSFGEPEESILAGWISIDKSISLGSGETKEVPYTVAVPANAEPGGHYGAVFFEPVVQTGPASGSGTTIAFKIDTLLLITVPGDIVYNGRIREFSTNKSFFVDSSNLVNFVSRFENLGTVHVKPKGTIAIRNLLGKTVAQLIVNEDSANILPDSIRRFENEWPKKYGFGFYSATLNLGYGENQTIAATSGFWMIPWKETLGVIIVIALLVWVFGHIEWKKKTN